VPLGLRHRLTCGAATAGPFEARFHDKGVTQTPTSMLPDPGGPVKLPETGGTDSGDLDTATAM
jgi:hypothetical protein